MKLGEILIKRKLISPGELCEVLAIQPEVNKKIGEILVEQQRIKPVDLYKALQEQHWRNNGYWVIG
jgi:hypothetical protein